MAEESKLFQRKAHWFVGILKVLRIVRRHVDLIIYI